MNYDGMFSNGQKKILIAQLHGIGATGDCKVRTNLLDAFSGREVFAAWKHDYEMTTFCGRQ